MTEFIFPIRSESSYQALTRYLGFPHYGDEYKVMGLAPYGRPSRQIVADAWRWHRTRFANRTPIDARNLQGASSIQLDLPIGERN